jgi:hypothetical protein
MNKMPVLSQRFIRDHVRAKRYRLTGKAITKPERQKGE